MEEGAEAPSEDPPDPHVTRVRPGRNGGGRRSALGVLRGRDRRSPVPAAMEEGAEAPSEPDRATCRWTHHRRNGGGRRSALGADIGLLLDVDLLAAMEEGAEAPSEPLRFG